MRPIMTAAELDSHRVDAHGRDYSRSDDGYSDMEVAAGEGWHAIAGWGRDGYDLGDWPYVVVSVRSLPAKVEVFGLVRPGDIYEKSAADLPAFLAELGRLDRDFFEVVQPPAFEMRQTCEGDTTVYRFDSAADRDAAIDYLFVWYGIGQEYDEWAVLGVTSREGLDAGTLRVPEELRGPYGASRI
jgi:hypothetical protein